MPTVNGVAPPADPAPEAQEVLDPLAVALGAVFPRTAPEPEPEPEPDAEAAPQTALVPYAPPAAREPEFRGPLECALRHPFLVTLLVLLGAGAGVAFGLTRDPEYTANARINVGRVDVPSYTLQGVISGNATLAGSYARTIAAAAVIGDASRDADVSPAFARAHLLASPIPDSTLISVEATGPNAALAVSLANAGSRALIGYVTESNREAPGSDLLDRFEESLARLDAVKRRVARIEARRPAQSTAVERARREQAAVQLEAETLRSQYAAAQGTGSGPTPLRLIVPAATATSDRDEVLQRVIFIGVVAGLLAGLALVLVRGNWKLLRRRRRS